MRQKSSYPRASLDLLQLSPYTSDLGTEVYYGMPRKNTKAVPEGNGPVSHHYQFGVDQPAMADLSRIIEKRLDRSDKQIDELTDTMRAINQRLAGLEHEARQPRLVTEADVEPDTKNCKSMEDAAADRAKHGDRSSSAQINHDPMRLISFGDYSTEPPAPEKPIGEALVDEGTEAPKPSQISTLYLGVVLRSPCVSHNICSRLSIFPVARVFKRIKSLEEMLWKYNPKRRKCLSQD